MMVKEWITPNITKISVKRDTKSGNVGEEEKNNASHSHAEPVPHQPKTTTP